MMMLLLSPLFYVYGVAAIVSKTLLDPDDVIVVTQDSTMGYVASPQHNRTFFFLACFDRLCVCLVVWYKIYFMR